MLSVVSLFKMLEMSAVAQRMSFTFFLFIFLDIGNEKMTTLLLLLIGHKKLPAR